MPSSEEQERTDWHRLTLWRIELRKVHLISEPGASLHVEAELIRPDCVEPAGQAGKDENNE